MSAHNHVMRTSPLQQNPICWVYTTHHGVAYASLKHTQRHASGGNPSHPCRLSCCKTVALPLQKEIKKNLISGVYRKQPIVRQSGEVLMPSSPFFFMLRFFFFRPSSFVRCLSLSLSLLLTLCCFFWCRFYSCVCAFCSTLS